MAKKASTSKAKKASTSKAKKASTAKTTPKAKRTRRTALFPAAPFEDALTIAYAIQKHAAGQKVRRLTLFDQMGKSADSGASRQFIINSNKYGLTKGSYTADYLELTTDGKLATGTDVTRRDQLSARFKLAIEKVTPFKALYDAQKGNRLPANSVLEDMAKENDIPDGDVKECVETFIVNAKFLGILRPIAGAERIIPIEQVLEETPAKPSELALNEGVIPPTFGKTVKAKTEIDGQNWDKVCFYISPIGDEGRLIPLSQVSLA